MMARAAQCAEVDSYGSGDRESLVDGDAPKSEFELVGLLGSARIQYQQNNYWFIHNARKAHIFSPWQGFETSEALSISSLIPYSRLDYYLSSLDNDQLYTLSGALIAS
jgi:hypothetical protein